MVSGKWLGALLPALLLCAALGSTQTRAQTSLAGTWGHAVDYQDFALRGPGPDPADFTGLPINAEARRVGLGYSAGQLSLPERQCLLYAPPYTLMNPGSFGMWPDYDANTGSVIAWNTTAQAGDVAGLKIWMDGRPHPSRYASHPPSGFTTGVWQGGVLSTYTTHMKRGYLRRNGTPQSDQATMTLHFIRHGTLLTVSGEINDPVYMTRSYILSRVLQLDPTSETSVNKGGCHPVVEVARFANIGTVPHYLDGNNPAGNYMTAQYNIPQFAAMGGAETMYPEFRKRMRSQYSAPKKCDKYCCGWDGFGAAANTIPACPTFFVFKTPEPYVPPAPLTP